MTPYRYRSKVEKAAEIIAQSNREHDETLKSISENEIKSKDRVDIPLSEYLRMKREIESLEREVERLAKMIIRMGFPAEVIEKIDLSSIQVTMAENPIDFRDRYRIEFDVFSHPYLDEWGKR